MKFEITAQNKKVKGERIFYYDNEKNEITDAAGFVLGHSTVQKSQRKETVPFDKNNPLKKSRKITTIKIQLGLSCNYSCDYCSQRFVERPPETSKKDIDDIRSAMGKLETFALHKIKNPAEYELLEMEFHQALVKPSGNQILALVNVALRNYFIASSDATNKKIMPIRKFDVENRELLEHRMLTYAFELKWPEIAEACLRKHLSHKP